jgi:hypothetical protein
MFHILFTAIHGCSAVEQGATSLQQSAHVGGGGGQITGNGAEQSQKELVQR